MANPTQENNLLDSILAAYCRAIVILKGDDWNSIRLKEEFESTDSRLRPALLNRAAETGDYTFLLRLLKKTGIDLSCIEEESVRAGIEYSIKTSSDPGGYVSSIQELTGKKPRVDEGLVQSAHQRLVGIGCIDEALRLAKATYPIRGDIVLQGYRGLVVAWDFYNALKLRKTGIEPEFDPAYTQAVFRDLLISPGWRARRQIAAHREKVRCGGHDYKIYERIQGIIYFSELTGTPPSLSPRDVQKFYDELAASGSHQTLLEIEKLEGIIGLPQNKKGLLQMAAAVGDSRLMEKLVRLDPHLASEHPEIALLLKPAYRT